MVFTIECSNHSGIIVVRGECTKLIYSVGIFSAASPKNIALALNCLYTCKKNLYKGGYSSIGRATVCGTVSFLFESGYPPV